MGKGRRLTRFCQLTRNFVGFLGKLRARLPFFPEKLRFLGYFCRLNRLYF